jgi:hypothetical protein
MGLMMNVASAFLSRVKARTALQNKDLETAKELLVGTVHIFENVLGSEWGREYEDFLKKNKVETQDLLNSIGGVGSA